MAHGSPDWGASRPVTTIYQLSDLGELAARLGSIVTFDRRGDVAWMDDFEDNIDKWVISAVGVGASAALSVDKARSGAKSAKLTTGDTVGAMTTLYRMFGLPVIKTRLGFEYSFVCHDDVAFYTHLGIYRLGTLYITSLLYDHSIPALQIQKTNGAYEDLTAGLDLSAGDAWHTIKLVSDFSSDGEYVRVLLDNNAPSVLGRAARQTATALADHVRVLFSGRTLTAANNSMYVDDVIVTQNEP